MLQHLLRTFRGTIRSGHDDDTFHKQILKKLLEDHGISDISHLKWMLQIYKKKKEQHYLG